MFLSAKSGSATPSVYFFCAWYNKAMDQEFSSLGQIFQAKKQIVSKKPPAYPWQDLALAVIKELGAPAQKRSSIFKVCKKYSADEIRRALNDTKELATGGEKWRYFFKVLENQGKEDFSPLPSKTGKNY